VNLLGATPFFRRRYLLAVIAGLLWSAAFPGINIAGFAWIAPGMMIAAALGKTGAESFRIGYVAGLAHYLSMLYWLLLIPYRWYGVPLAPAAGWLALSAFLALYPATWVWIVSKVQSPKSKVQNSETEVQRPKAKEQRTGTEITTQQPLVAGLQFSGQGQIGLEDESEELRGVLARSWLRRMLWTVSGAAMWVALEMVIARFLGGFPWDLLGVSQYHMLPLIQIASITGVYGVSFLVVWLSLALLSAGLMVIRRPTARSIWVGEIFVPVIVVAILFNLGFRQLNQAPDETRTLKVALIQPSIPQTLIWDTSKNAERFQELIKLSEQALTNQVDLIIWPEAAVPKLLRYDQETFDAITGLARRHQVWLIVGADDAERRHGSSNPNDADYFNSSFLISPEGKLVQRYIKRNLVIFGEYLPLQNWLPFLKYFTPIEGGFTPGTNAVQFALGDLDVQTATLICFEDVFPHLTRTDVRPETSFLVNITNDGWFDEGPEQWQHAFSALLRTVENRRPLIRCTNNGLTCWIDEQGRLRDVFRDSRGTIYGPGYLIVGIPLAVAGQDHSLTFYTRRGDCFGWICVAVGGICLIRRVIQNRFWFQKPL
jgi:apolipoprotein N-acyltransferase